MKDPLDILVSNLPATDQELAKDEINTALLRSKQQEEARRIKNKERNGGVQVNTTEARMNDLARYIRDLLQISEEVDDEEIIDALLDDFPQYKYEIQDYLNKGDETIFTLLQ